VCMCVLGACRPEPSTKTSLYYGKFFSAWSTRRAQSKQKKERAPLGVSLSRARGDKKKGPEKRTLPILYNGISSQKKAREVDNGGGRGGSQWRSGGQKFGF